MDPFLDGDAVEAFLEGEDAVEPFLEGELVEVFEGVATADVFLDGEANEDTLSLRAGDAAWSPGREVVKGG